MPQLERRLRILTWHVHGNYLYYLSQVPHDFYLVTRPGDPPGYAGRTGQLPWGDNVHELPELALPGQSFDCVLYQSARHYAEDRLQVLDDAQRSLPAIYLEHDPPQQHPTNTLHPVQDERVLLVHVTPFNALMWDSGITPHCVIEHGVVVPPGVHYSGELPRGVVVVNNMRGRGRRLGRDVFEEARRAVPLDLVGMDAESLDGIGEIGNLQLAAFTARYRFFFNPIRYTSLGLSIIEAMMIGVPVVGLATTELATVVRNDHNGYVDTDPQRLVTVMRRLIADPGLARDWGEAGRRLALERFGIGRFIDDWCTAFARVTA
ncbi:glycosyltransferase [Uliginosibacterium sp. sgz301328]|uniref:glycosyltransferase n=1 Tax=Uliginosibacterium sp. sgz301328 TaxID=3243764 RepID=UPI00359E1806